MGRYKYSIVLIVVVLILLFAFLSFYLNLFRYGSIAFISGHPSYRWSLNSSNVGGFEQVISEAAFFQGKTIVFLSPYVKETEFSTSVPTKITVPPDPDSFLTLFYGDWIKIGNFNILSIYVMPDNFEVSKKNNPKLSGFVLSSFMSLQFNQKFSLTPSQLMAINSLMKTDNEPKDYIVDVQRRFRR